MKTTEATRGESLELTAPNHANWLQLANMTDEELAIYWQEWDQYANAIICAQQPNWPHCDSACAIRDQISRYAGARLISRILSNKTQ